MVTNLWVEEMRKQDRKELRKKRMNWFKFSVLMFVLGALIGFILCYKSHAIPRYLELKEIPEHESCSNHTTVTVNGDTSCWDYNEDDFLDTSIMSFIIKRLVLVSNRRRHGWKKCTCFKDDSKTSDEQYQLALNYWKPIYRRAIERG
jgi:hypothetical protein